MSTILRSLAAACVLTLALTHAAAAQEAPAPGAPPAAAPVKLDVKPLAAADAEKYVGDYDISLPDGRILPFRIFLEGGAVMGQAEGQGAAPLLYLGDNTFGAEFDHTVRLSFLVENGKVVSGKLLQRGATMNVTRRQ